MTRHEVNAASQEPGEQAGFVAVQRRRRATRAQRHHPQSDVATVIDPASPGQCKLMFVLWNQTGIVDRDERLAVTSRIVGRGIESSNQLSKTEAQKVIDSLSDETFDPSDDGLF